MKSLEEYSSSELDELLKVSLHAVGGIASPKLFLVNAHVCD